MDILFGSNPPEDSGDKEISVEMCTSQKNYANTISYKIPQSYIHSVMKKSAFVKSTYFHLSHAKNNLCFVRN